MWPSHKTTLSTSASLNTCLLTATGACESQCALASLNARVYLMLVCVGFFRSALQGNLCVCVTKEHARCSQDTGSCPQAQRHMQSMCLCVCLCVLDKATCNHCASNFQSMSLALSLSLCDLYAWIYMYISRDRPVNGKRNSTTPTPTPTGGTTPSS